MPDNKKISILEWITIISFCILPLFLSYPYRINIFLSWEGAYRISEGQLPFRDFGLPLGFVYWLIPAFFFKVFGPYMLTLVKAQVFINLVTLISFREILKHFEVKGGERLITLLLFCISYIMINFWPWYNNSVFMYQVISLLFLVKSIKARELKLELIFLALSVFFGVLSFFTKQDGGALAIVMNMFLLGYVSWSNKKWWYLPYYGALTFIGFLIFILPFSQYDFGYWFNYGQEPHFSRLDIRDLFYFIFQGSFWLKFYLVVIITLIFLDIRVFGFKKYIEQTNLVLFTLLTLGIIVQASIIQVTSYVPINNNIYFHSFCIAFIVSKIKWPFNTSRLDFALIGCLMVMIWWSGTYFKYVNRVVSRMLPKQNKEVKDRVSVNTYASGVGTDTSEVQATKSAAGWVPLKEMKAFKGMLMPKTTVEGIERLAKLTLWKEDSKPKVLNMTELTPLAYEFDFELERGSNIPLWFHQNVSFFDREMELYKNRIQENFYDLILYENIPNLNNFYPFEIREYLYKHYKLIDTFDAPRKHGGSPKIEVFVPK